MYICLIKYGTVLLKPYISCGYINCGMMHIICWITSPIGYMLTRWPVAFHLHWKLSTRPDAVNILLCWLIVNRRGGGFKTEIFTGNTRLNRATAASDVYWRSGGVIIQSVKTDTLQEGIMTLPQEGTVTTTLPDLITKSINSSSGHTRATVPAVQ